MLRPEDELIYGEGLSPEGRQILSEASAAMDKWITDTVKGMGETVRKEAEAEYQSIQKSVEAAEATMDKLQSHIERCRKDSKDLLKLDSAGLAKASDDMQAALKAVDEELAQIRKQFESMGRQAGKFVINTAAKAAGSPINIA